MNITITSTTRESITKAFASAYYEMIPHEERKIFSSIIAKVDLGQPQITLTQSEVAILKNAFIQAKLSAEDSLKANELENQLDNG